MASKGRGTKWSYCVALHRNPGPAHRANGPQCLWHPADGPREGPLWRFSSDHQSRLLGQKTSQTGTTDVTSAFGPIKRSPSRAPAITRMCLGRPTLQGQEKSGRWAGDITEPSPGKPKSDSNSQNLGLQATGPQSRPWKDRRLRVRRKGVPTISHQPSQRGPRGLECQPWQRVCFCSHDYSALTVDFMGAEQGGVAPGSRAMAPSYTPLSVSPVLLPARASGTQMQLLAEWTSCHSKI